MYAMSHRGFTVYVVFGECEPRERRLRNPLGLTAASGGLGKPAF